MVKIGKIKLSERKDLRGGGYSKRKFTTEEANSIREEWGGGTRGVTQSQLARKYNVSQPLMAQLLNGVTYNE